MKYLAIPMEVVLRFGQDLRIDIYLEEADDSLKFKVGDKDRMEIIKKHHDDGVDFLYVIQDENDQYFKSLKNNLMNQFADVDTNIALMGPEQVMDSCHQMIMTGFGQTSISDDLFEQAKDLAQSSLKMIEGLSEVNEIFDRFRFNCSTHFINGLYTGYLTTFILEQFDWANTAIKKKMSLAGMLCDATLEWGELEEARDKVDTPEQLSEKVRLHPFKMRDILQKAMDSHDNELLNIIAEHHEKPDGKGYPEGLGPDKVGLLTAIFIIAYDFVNKLGSEGMEQDAINETLNSFGKFYQSGKYKKAYQALKNVFYPEAGEV